MRLAVQAGFDPITAIQMATLNTAALMRLDRDRGSVAPGKLADLVVVDDLATFEPSLVIHGGTVVARNGQLVTDDPEPRYPEWATATINLAGPITAENLTLQVEADGPVTANVVEFGGPKTMRTAKLQVAAGVVTADPAQDIAYIAVLERHRASGAVGRGFVGGLGISGGAVACTVNHDSHNIFVVGDNHESMAAAANAVAVAGGGYGAVVGTEVRALAPLPIAGLLSEATLDELADQLDSVESVLLDELGCSVRYRPLYALNFLCLPNIPNVGVTDQGIIETASMTRVASVVVGP